MKKCDCCASSAGTVHSCFKGHDCRNARCEWCGHKLKRHTSAAKEEKA